MISGALARWAIQSVKRDFRGYSLIAALVAFAVAIVSFAALFASQLSVSPDFAYGSATHLLSPAALENRTFDDVIAAAEETFGANGPVQPIFHGKAVRLPGGFGNPFLSDGFVGSEHGGAELIVVKGRLPQSADEVAKSIYSAKLDKRFGYPHAIGDTFDFGGESRTIVGIVSDPTNDLAELALVAPGTISEPESVSIIITADSEQQLYAFLERAGGRVGWQDFSDNQRDQVMTIVITYSAAVVLLLLIGLLCSTGFAVMLRRRVRNFAILASLGARPSELRWAMAVTGIAVGMAGAIAGAAAGAAMFVAARGLLRSVFHRPIAVEQINFAVVIPAIVLAVVATTFASLAPASQIFAASTQNALRQTVGKRRPWPLFTALVLTVATSALWVHAGVFTLPIAAVCAALAAVMFAPSVAVLLTRFTKEAPIALRLAGAELGLSRMKTAAAVASVTIVAATTLGIGLVGSAVDTHEANSPDSLPTSALIIRPAFGVEIGAEVASERIAEIAAHIDNARIIPIESTTSVSVNGEVQDAIISQVLPNRVEGVIAANEITPWVATPELFDALGIDTHLANSEQPVLSRNPALIQIGGWAESQIGAFTPELLSSGREFLSVSNMWVTPTGLAEYGFGTQTHGWFIDMDAEADLDTLGKVLNEAGTDFDVEAYVPKPESRPIAGIALNAGTLISALSLWR